MKRWTWISVTCASAGLLVLLLIGLNWSQADAQQGSSARAAAALDDDREEHDGDHEEHDGDHEEHDGDHEEHDGDHEEHDGDHEEHDGDQEEGRERLFRFSKDGLGEVPDGWTVAKTGRGEGSEWKVVEDATSPSGKGCVLAQTAKSPGRMFNLCVVDDSCYGDVEVEVVFKAVAGKVDQGGGIVWRYQDADNYYIARMNPLEDNYRLYKVVDGKRTQLATKEGLNVPAGEWHTLEIVCRGKEIRCELDDQRVLAAEDDTFSDAGQVGLWTKADAQTYFDNFEVEGR